MEADGLEYLELLVIDEVTEMHLSNETAAETGIRLRLMLIAGTGRIGPIGALPVDDEALARLAHVSIEEWRSAKAAVSAGWELQGDRWMIPEVREQAKKRNARSRSASKAARSRWGKRNRRRRPSDTDPDGKPGMRSPCVRNAPALRTHGERPELTLELGRAKKTPGKSSASTTLRDNAPALRTHCERIAGAMRTQCPLKDKDLREELKSSSTSRLVNQEGLSTELVDKPAADRWLTPEQEQELANLIGQLKDRYPRHWGHLGEMVQQAFHKRPPFEVFRHALRQLLKHEAESPIHYAEKILRVEIPNYHARAAADRHARHQRAAVVGFEVLGQLLTRAQARGGRAVARGGGA